ncbi:hypothetical protein BDR05DRAFT_1007070 [Suillus weaverae]|nr:hypothetical protein BDR05DRAFT_1007070 [Suillus weaverae]
MNCRVPQPCYIGKLPMEIISQIFMLAAHGDTPSGFPQSVMLPHALASVDLRWRTVALCNHGLWSSVVIDLQKDVPQWISLSELNKDRCRALKK